MTITQITEKLKSPEYDFLKTDPHLGNQGLCSQSKRGNLNEQEFWTTM